MGGRPAELSLLVRDSAPVSPRGGSARKVQLYWEDEEPEQYRRGVGFNTPDGLPGSPAFSPARVSSPRRASTPTTLLRGSCARHKGRLGFVEDDEDVLRSPRRHSHASVNSVAPATWDSSPRVSKVDPVVGLPSYQQSPRSPRARSPARLGSPARSREKHASEARSRFHVENAFWKHGGVDSPMADFQSSLRTYFPSPKSPEPTVVKYSDWEGTASPHRRRPRTPHARASSPSSPRSASKRDKVRFIKEMKETRQNANFMAHLRDYDPIPDSEYHKQSPRYPPPVFIAPEKSKLRQQVQREHNVSLPLREKDGLCSQIAAHEMGENHVNSQFLASLRSPRRLRPKRRSSPATPTRNRGHP